jgi:glutamate synthase (NADPH/NADH) small chain
MEKIERHAMPMQSAAERVKNFDESALGYDEETAVEEAKRCLGCKVARCMEGCPLKNNIPAFIAKVKERDFDGAMAEIEKTSDFSLVCSRVCPQEEQCEKKCVLALKDKAVAIGNIERFVADYKLAKRKKREKLQPFAKNAKKAAVIGSGPAGLSVANELNKRGYRVSVFEAEKETGGILYYGIPEFRLPKESVVKPLLREMAERGIEFVTNVVIGEDYTVDSLLEDKGFAAVFVGTGAGATRRMDIRGNDASGVWRADDFLTKCNEVMLKRKHGTAADFSVGEKVAVVGGGNVAMDVARTARRLGAKEVRIVYRRSEAELPARKDEIQLAKEEGVIFCVQHNPTEIITEDGKAIALKCARTKLGDLDESGRRSCKDIDGTAEIFAADTVVFAIGQKARARIKDTTEGLDTSSRGYIITNAKTGETTRQGVFAGGDVVTGAATVAKAIEGGKCAAQAMDEYLRRLK